MQRFWGPDIQWSARSPDPTPCDLCVGYLKYKVYKNDKLIHTDDDLQEVTWCVVLKVCRQLNNITKFVQIKCRNK